MKANNKTSCHHLSLLAFNASPQGLPVLPGRLFRAVLGHLFLAGAALLATHQAQGAVIVFSTGGMVRTQVSGGVNDWVAIGGYADTALTLDAGSPVTANINSFYFEVDPTDFWSGSYGFTLTRIMTINGVTQTLVQDGHDNLGFVFDSAHVSMNSTPTVFTLPEGTVAVTPLALDTPGQRNYEGKWYTLQASILYTPVPEPSMLILLTLSGLVILGRTRR